MMDTLTIRLSSHSAAAFSGKQHHIRLPGVVQAPSRHNIKQQRRDKEHTFVAHAAATDVADKKEEYNKSMGEQMKWGHLNPYEYHPERGLYYHEVAPNLLCGSQPQSPADIERLHAEGVTNIVNLQEDKDFAYWGVDFEAYRRRATELGMFLDRRPIVDFDGESLRRNLPRIVLAIAGALLAGGRVYVHCTAGLGRAPAACIAWRYWFNDMQLDEAYTALTAIRPCGPKREAIRAATYDLLDSRGWHEFQSLPSDAYAFLNHDDRARLQHRIRERC
ncbi:g3711 [Coccomyxa elongata]